MSKMIARRIPKQNVQAMLKALREAKLNVTKDSLGGYRCEQDGHTLFAALPGRSDYLVRMRADLFG